MRAINDADAAISTYAALREVMANNGDAPDTAPVTITIITDPNYGLLGELSIGELTVAVIPIYNFDDFVEVTEIDR